jgi:N-acetylneuraminic acid mutarotase
MSLKAIVSMRPVIALVVLLAATGCRSGDKHDAAKDAATTATQPGGAPAGGSGAATGGADVAAGPSGDGAAVDGATGGAPGDGVGAGGTGGTGRPGIAPKGSGPIVGAPTDPGAGPSRPKGWRKLPAAPLRSRHSASAVWTGREMIVWGGAWRAGNASIWLDDGAAYDPAADRWRKILGSPLAGRSDAFIAWTGSQVLIWGGQRQDSLTGFGDEWSDGALYDPARNTWKPMAGWPLAERFGARAVWTGKRLIVWGGASASAGKDPPPLADGAAYDPADDKWTKLPPAPLAGRIAPLAGARGDAALVSWGPGELRDGRRVPTADSALYDAGANRWSPAAAAPAPPKQTWCVDASECVGVDTGSKVLFAGQGLAWDAGGNRWSTVAAGQFADPLLEGKAQAWTGSRVMLWGGGTADSAADAPPATVTAAGAAYDPAADRWDALPSSPLAPRARATAVWTGREFIVWGGEADHNHRAQFDDGAALTP